MTVRPPNGILGAAAREPTRGARAAELAGTALRLPDDTTVTVPQLSCREPGCPPVATVIAVLATQVRRLRPRCPWPSTPSRPAGRTGAGEVPDRDGVAAVAGHPAEGTVVCGHRSGALRLLTGR